MRLFAAAGILLFFTASLFAAPHPADSVIIESKTVTPIAGPCGSAGLKVRVWITNKDSLAIIVLPFETRSLSGGAYATLSRRADCKSFNPAAPFERLLPAEEMPTVFCNFQGYNARPPDTVLFTMSLNNPGDDVQKLEPNLQRRPLIDVKFDSVFSAAGQFALDSSRVLANTIMFVNLRADKVDVNFVKGIITVNKPKKKAP